MSAGLYSSAKAPEGTMGNKYYAHLRIPPLATKAAENLVQPTPLGQ